MSGASADRNLFYGILALQLNCITQDQFVEGMQTWVQDKARTLEQILLDRGVLAPEDHNLLAPMVARQLAKHDGEIARSLASLPIAESTQVAVASITDQDLQASVTHLRHTNDATDESFVPGATIAHVAGDEALAHVGTPTGARFRVLRSHAKGGFGQVFIAHDEELGRQVALKEIQSKYRDNETLRRRFLLEAEINGNLEHPNIVPVYSLGAYEDGRPFYAMRLIQGESLKEAIVAFHDALPTLSATEYNLRLRQLLSRFVDVCDAIAYAHSRGVLHRDLKPSNIMLGQYGETLIIDWGLAKTAEQSDSQSPGFDPVESTLLPSSGSLVEPTIAGSALGTPGYMSPEQAEGRVNELGPSTDVYGLGATLYALLTNHAPVEGANVVEILTQVKQGQIAAPNSLSARVPPALAAVCMKALAQRPEDRYRSARELETDVERFLADEPVSAHRDTLSVHTWRWVRKHRTFSAAAVVAGLAALLALTVIWRREAVNAEEIAGFSSQLQQANVSLQRANADAESRLKQAIGSYEEYYTGVNEELLRSTKPSDPLLALLLERPRQYFEQLTAELSEKSNPEESELALLARGRRSLGRILYRLGHYDEARQQQDEAVVLYQSLVTDHPASNDYRLGLARSNVSLAITLELTSQLEAARDAVTQAIALFESITHDFPDNLEYTAEQGGSYNTLGNVLHTLGDLTGAGEAYAKAIQLRTEVVAAQSDSSERRTELADSTSNYAIVLATSGDADAASELFRKVVVLREEILRDRPDDPDARARLALAFTNVGIDFSFAGDNVKAAEQFRRSLEQYETLVQQEPGVANYRAQLAECLGNLGDSLAGESPIEAIKLFRRSIEQYDLLINDQPDVFEYRSAHGRRYVDIGDALLRNDDFSDAVSEYQQAVREFEALVVDRPDQPAYLSLLGAALNNMGEAQFKQENYEQAEACFREAISHQSTALNAAPRVAQFRQFLGNHYTNLTESLLATNRAESAVEPARQYIALWVNDPQQLYKGACLLCLCIQDLPTATNIAIREELAAEAVATLEQAIAAGWSDRGQMVEDPNLSVLRQREDFQQLLSRLRKSNMD